MKRTWINHGLFIFCYLGIMALIGVDFNQWSIRLTVLLPCVIIIIADIIQWWRSRKKSSTPD